jgi:ERF superfamily
MTLEQQLEESIRQVKERTMKTNGSDAGALLSATPRRGQQISESSMQQQSHDIAPDVYRAICEVAKAISRDGVAKSGRNQQQGYSFRGIDEIMNALSPLLADAQLCILPRMLSRTQEERTTTKGGVLFYVTVHARFAFVSARDGSRHTVVTYGEAMDSADKATNKAMSAAYKYAVMQAFCIPTESMPDADQTTPEPAPKAPGKAPVANPRAGTQAAADAVAQAKIAAGSGQSLSGQPRQAPPAPWTTRGQMKQCFARIRERVGEVVYLDALKRFNATTDLNWRSSADALACYEWLVEQAVM